MSAPAHSRPFDLAAARAGAPFSTKFGALAKFIAHAPEASAGQRVVLLIDGRISTRFDDGRHFESDRTPGDLVMLPLGFIDGKPVFVGDKLVDKDLGDVHQALPTWHEMDADLWTWPAPPKVYPETLMDDDDLRHAAGMNHNNMTMTVRHLQSAANAALRHAIDAGQVVDAEQSAEAIRKAYADGQAIAYKHEDAGRAARDMAVARAVSRAAQERFHRQGMFSGEFVWDEIESLNLPVIAASAK